MIEHIERAIEGHMRDQLLPAFAAVLVTGPRAVGKTTSMQRLTTTHLDLNIPSQRLAVSDDPDAALRDLPTPVLIDEWQLVPEVVGAVKRAVDRDPTPGQFVLTGSCRGPLDDHLWGGTGRLLRVRMYGLSQAERAGWSPNVFDELLGAPDSLATGLSSIDRSDYLLRATTGGFPAAVALDDIERQRWYRSYREQLIERDAIAVRGIREPQKLSDVLEASAARVSQELRAQAMNDTVGIARATLATHLDLLENLQVLWRLPAWTANRHKRLIKAPKLHLCDTGLACAVLRVDAKALQLDGNLAGAVIESFVANELLRAAQTSSTPVDLYHAREQSGREVDVVAITTDGRIMGFEVKSGASVGHDDGRGLRWLRDLAGQRFVAGYVLHTGSMSRQLSDRLWAAPISALWGDNR